MNSLRTAEGLKSNHVLLSELDSNHCSLVFVGHVGEANRPLHVTNGLNLLRSNQSEQ